MTPSQPTVMSSPFFHGYYRRAGENCQFAGQFLTRRCGKLRNRLLRVKCALLTRDLLYYNRYTHQDMRGGSALDSNTIHVIIRVVVLVALIVGMLWFFDYRYKKGRPVGGDREAPKGAERDEGMQLEEKRDAEAGRFCTNCGAEADPESKFCGRCGHALR